MRKIFVLLLLLWAADDTNAQLFHKDLEQRYISLPDQSLQFQVCTDELRVRPAQQLVYYWVNSGKLHHSKGDFHGELLHGNFTSFFVSRQLKSKGQFRKGLKHGVWKTWFDNGELKTITHWKKGVQHGQRKSFTEEGDLAAVANYKHGRLHGDQLSFANDSILTQERYKKGKLQVVEEAVADTTSEEREILEMITPDDAAVEPEAPKEKWFKRILPKRKRKATDEAEEAEEAKVEEEPGA